jgi:hypothetical protein
MRNDYDLADVDDLGEPAAGPGRRTHPPARWLAPMVAAVVVVAVFGVIATVGWSRHHTGNAAPGNTSGSSATLGLWASFPVDAVPRPLVLTGPDVLDPASGFGSGNGKLAFISGDFELRTTLPVAPVTVKGQRISSAAEALAELRGEGTKPPEATPLAITGVGLSIGTFPTDRGARELPAWSFRFAGVAEPALVLAISPADRWPRPGMPTNDGPPAGATISADGTKATVSFLGAAAGTGPCQAEYAADVRQARTSVLVSIRQLPHPKDSPDPKPTDNGDPATMCAAVGYTRTVTVNLQPPLGNRVLIDAHGAPLPVH